MRPTANCWRDRAMHASLLHQDTFCYAEENGEPHGGASSRTVPRVHVALWWKAIKAQLWADHKMTEFFVSITTIYSISLLLSPLPCGALCDLRSHPRRGTMDTALGTTTITEGRNVPTIRGISQMEQRISGTLERNKLRRRSFEGGLHPEL
jgi:hypothetical protein